MKQIIKEILEAEERVGNTLQQARQKASEIRLAAEKEISDRTNDARQKAREIVQAAVEEARQEAQHIREERLRQADQQEQALLAGGTGTRDGLIARLCTTIMATDYEIDER